MHLLLTSAASQWGQLITVLLIFVFVLAITAATTKWIGNYQRDKFAGSNLDVIEARKVDQNNYIEIVRIGDRYFALGVNKNNISTIAELSEDSLHIPEKTETKFSFKEILQKARDDGEE